MERKREREQYWEKESWRESLMQGDNAMAPSIAANKNRKYLNMQCFKWLFDVLCTKMQSERISGKLSIGIHKGH